MKGAVVFHSRWGNCREIAERVARGLEESGHEVELIEATSCKGLDSALDFLVMGSPTRGGRMTGAMRRFIRRRMKEGWEGKRFAAFGTGMRSFRENGLEQSADNIYKLLKEKGLKPIAPSHKAAVIKTRGPLASGELESASEFGKQIGKTLTGEQKFMNESL
jgi:flavodoxin